MQEELDTLVGTIEEIVYHNDENDYTVLELIDRKGHMQTAVGYMALAAEGEDVTLYGSWKTHAEYGEQFSFQTQTAPHTRHGAPKIRKALHPRLPPRRRSYLPR